MVKTSLKLAGALCAALPLTAFADRGMVMTLSNQVSGNSIITFVRNNNGRLTRGDVFPTGGTGTGAGLGSQGAISVSADGSVVIAVNPGSNSITLFRKDDDDLQFEDVEPSGGVKPISVTQSGRFVYVLNAGNATHPNNIQEFVIYHNRLVLIPDGSANLSGPNVGPAQISLTPAGDALVVTEKGTNQIDTFGLDWFDRPISSNFQASFGQTPFGFDFGARGLLFVTEAFGGAANASALSSYKIRADLSLELVSGSVLTHQTAACWAATSKNKKWVYASNTGSGNVSGYGVNYRNGTVHLLDPSGISGVTGGATIDSAFDRDGKYLFVLAGTTNAITSFRVAEDGSLVNLGSISGLPSGSVGLAAR